VSYQRVKYELFSDELGLLSLIHDPIGWQEDNKTLERSASSESFFTRFSNNISFIREGADYIRRYINAFGTRGNLFCRRFEIDPTTDEFVKVYEENLDLESYEFDNDVVSIGFLSGGLNELIKAQFKEKFELQRTKSIQEKDIGNISYKTLRLNGRKIFLETFLTNPEDISISSQNSAVENFFSFNQIIQYQNDEYVNNVINGVGNFIGFGNSGGIFFDPNQVFYTNDSGRDRTFKITFKAKGEQAQSFSGNQRLEFALQNDLVYNTGNNQYDGNVNNRVIISVFQEATLGNVLVFDIEETVLVTVEKGKALGLYGWASTFNSYAFSAREESISIKIEEDSTYFPTKAKGVLFKEALERTLKIITGRDNVLKSDFFTNTMWSNLFITSGIFLREFPENVLDEDGNLIKDESGATKTNGIITSLEELLSVKAHLNIGWGVERIRGIEFFRVEPLGYFFQNRVTIRLGGKFSPKRTIAKEFIYGSVSIGNPKSGNYEEQQGLFEYNARNTWTTANVQSENKYDLSTTLRTDPIGAEHTRRKTYSISPTLDTPEDKENWIFHVKEVSTNNYTVRLWQDDFDEEPKQVYDPLSAYNLLLSPLRSLERHGWYLNSSLLAYKEDNVLFSNSSGNANMITKLPEQIERGENKPYPNSDLSRPRFVYEYLDFDFPNNFYIKQQINGYFTDSKGNMVPNFYGMVEYTNENDELTYGWILKVVENDLGSFRLIKANR